MLERHVGALAFSLALLAATCEVTAATPAISAGYGQVVILRSDGSVLQAGATQPYSPATSPFVLPGITGTVAIAARWDGLTVLKDDGTVWSIGGNKHGSIGDGTTTDTTTLRRVVGLDRITQVHCRSWHCLALRSDGAVWSWGENNAGQIGDGTTVDRPTPLMVFGAGNIVAVSTSQQQSLALASDGTVWFWGSSGTETSSTPKKILGMTQVKAVASSGGVNLFLKTDGTVWASGYAGEGGLGNHSVPNGGTFVQVDDISDIVAISANAAMHFALKRDGTVWGWGLNRNGVMGSGDFTRVLFDAPSKVVGLANIIAIEAGDHSAYALAADGSVYAWGGNDVGQLGDNTITDRAAPVRMVGPGGVGTLNFLAAQAATNKLPSARLALSAKAGAAPLTVTANASASNDADGTITGYEWYVSDGRTATGSSAQFAFGQPGTYRIDLLVRDNSGATAQALDFVTVTSAAGPVQAKAMVAGNWATFAALRSDGKAFSWGFSSTTGRQSSRWQEAIPGAIENIAGVTSIAMGGSLGLAVLSDGSVAGWGRNASGEVGDGTTVPRQSPVTVQGITNVVAVAAGDSHALALKADGTVWSWGTNRHGELGNGTLSDRKVPGQVIGLSGIKAIAAGAFFSVALKSDDTVWAWGSNEFSQLGDATKLDRLIAAPIARLSGIKRIWCGQSRCFAADAGGDVWAWGANFSAEFGLGHSAPIFEAVVVPALKGFTEFAVSAQYTVGVHPDGSVWHWGRRVEAQPLGGPPPPIVYTPTPVPGIRKAIAVGATANSGVAVALNADGTLLAWGGNTLGEVGDGTLVPRTEVVSVLNDSLDGLLDLLPNVPNDPSLSKSVALFTKASSTGALTDPTLTVDSLLRFNAADVGKSGGVYVFALAPATMVRNASANFAKDGSVACVLAQLNASGQLQAVSVSSLQAYATGVFSGQGQAVNVLNGVPTASIGGATFLVGYGTSPSAMINNGTNRGVASVPGSSSCVPQPPQKGWWWNPAEGGRGYSIETSGNKLFFASYLYDVSGRATWLIAAGPTSLDGSLFVGKLESYSGGQSLGGSYRAPAGVVGQDLTLAFTDASHGTMIWPGGSVAIERFNIVPNGLSMAPAAGQPEGGWWWNPDESGRGFFLEWQGSQLFMAGYMYDDAGNPVWYLSGNSTPSPNLQSYSNSWQLYGNGQTLMGPYRPPQQMNGNVAPVTITFQGAESGIVTLPNGRTTAIRRFRF